VKVSAVEGNLVLSGTVATLLQATNVETMVKSFMGGQSGLINNMVVLSSMQVNVRVRVVEMSRSVARDLGINWKAIGQIGNFSFAYLSPQVTAASTLTSMGRLASNLVGVGYQSGGWDVNAVVDALATDNLVSILAEPNLTAMSGEPASFLAGGEFPVSTQQSSGGGVVGGAAVFTTEYKQFGVGLAVVPTVLAPGRINMRIRPEVSDVNTAITDRQGNPGISTRRAETTIELGSGQSFAIAGLLSNSVRDQLSTLPWLGEIPVLGALFRSQRFQRQETELVIIVTPYIVEPVSASAQLRTPADGFVPATDLNRLLYGSQMRGESGRAPARPLDAGFILK